jgi:GMP synthase (glutamine-hydrolysing)
VWRLLHCQGCWDFQICSPLLLLLAAAATTTHLLAPPPHPRAATRKRMSASPSKRAKASGQLTADRPQLAILDFGSQFSHLIARRVRELNVFCELYSCKVDVEELKSKKVLGVILSGGPSSVYDKDAPHADAKLWTWAAENKVPILGICYGMQEMCHRFGGVVSPSTKREYGKALVSKSCESVLFAGIPGEDDVVWMSHGDKCDKLPQGFSSIAHTDNSPHAAVQGPDNMFGLQFHPEVTHSVHGKALLKNFCVGVCNAPTDWNMKSIASTFIEDVRAKVGDKGHVVGAVSGGVDSSVAAVLLNKAIGKRFHAVMVDNGCLRLGEGKMVVARLKEKEGIDLHLVDASDRFLAKLKGVTDPETKRKIIGNLFIDVFQEEAARIRESLPEGDTVDYLLQGTLCVDERPQGLSR